MAAQGLGEPRAVEASSAASAGPPLAGCRVLDLSSTTTGAQVTQTLADAGAEVILVEPPGGTPLRRVPAWPFWGRGKHSVVLDLHEGADRDRARRLAATADVVVETWRPGVAERLGLGYDELAALNPRLVYASITAFGRENPLCHLKGYEPVVMAKLGMLDAASRLTARPGPAFVASPYCSFSASQTALHGILAALFERERSGCGQRVDATLVQGVLAHDNWDWLLRLLAHRFPDAFASVGATTHTARGVVPNSPLFLRLMVGFTKDGHYMQFAQVSERLWQAFRRVTGLGELMGEGWSPPDDPEERAQWLDKAIEITRSKTYAEWLEVFDREPDVWADVFRDGSELLDHPQLVADGRIVTVDDPLLGPVRQPGPLVAMPLGASAPITAAPALGAHGERGWTSAPTGCGAAVDRPDRAGGPPLAGVTVLELGSNYAGPFGATLLAELGARVIKVEPLSGDPHRRLAPFPEVAGIKPLQGKESVAVDIATEEGRAIVLELARRADVVLQSWRAGAAARHGLAAADLLAVNSRLVYLNAPGYGVGPPYGRRPAYAPSIGAATGLAYRNVGGRGSVPAHADLTADEVRTYSQTLGGATTVVGNADAFSALGVATALLLGLLGTRRHGCGQELATSMLSTMAHVLADDMVDYEGRPPLPTPDPHLLGLGARYRLYEAADGWVFLAAPQDREWQALASELGLPPDLADDDAQLATVLGELFRQDGAAAWEARLGAVDVACAAVAAGPVEDVVWFTGGVGTALGIVTEAEHPVLGTYPRLKPTVTLSRTPGVTGNAPLCGQDTVAALQELGLSAERIDVLRAAGVVATPED